MKSQGSGHITLIGDSIFDNGAYTGREPDVISHLRAILPRSWDATLCAVDGATCADVGAQLGRVPHETSHLAVAVGGNDALQNMDLLSRQVRSTGDALALFGDRVHRFEQAYRAAIDKVLRLGKHTTICTIYNGDLEPEEARLARVGLMMFNDAILRVGFERRLSIIELRLVCNEPADYANPIEPSGRGGWKIATAVARAIGAIDGDARSARVFVE